LRDLLLKNLGWKLLSLALAALLWIAVASEPELSTFASVRVQYKNLSPALEINSDVVEQVLLEVRGPSGELRGTQDARQRFAVVLDMTGMEPGQHTFTIDRQDVRLPRGIELVRAVPAQIRLIFENSAARHVPVELRFAPGLPPTLQVIQAVAEPASLAIAGPASQVAHVASVRIDPIELTPQPGTRVYHVDAYIRDPYVRFQDSPSITVKVTLGKK
jgi:YbbR domain-containing protein